jgi:hypothetical protein
MIYKRATQQLRNHGILDLVIEKRRFGATPMNPAWARQQSRCFKDATEAVNAVLSGYRPTEGVPCSISA